MLPSANSYLQAGHAGWLGWPANISPAAQLFGSLYTQAGSPASVRGLATNVANYNALVIFTLSFSLVVQQTHDMHLKVASSPDPITQNNPNYDEMLYITALAPLLTQYGFP
jgi:cellulose 1,4-beta-cellobiosidase